MYAVDNGYAFLWKQPLYAIQGVKCPLTDDHIGGCPLSLDKLFCTSFIVARESFCVLQYSYAAFQSLPVVSGLESEILKWHVTKCFFTYTV